MPALSGGQITTLRTHPHSLRLYLAVLKPTTIYTARVNDGGIEKGERVLVFDGGVGTIADIMGGMSLWVDADAVNQQGKGRLRIKSYTDDGGGTGTITVAENGHIDWADNDFLTVKEIHEYWPIYPRITNGGGLTFYKDYDVAYTDQNEKFYPVPVMGPPAVAFLDGATVDVYFDGQGSWCPGTTIAWGGGNSTWTFPSGTPGTSTAETPGNVSWDTAGTYWVNLTAKDTANGKLVTGWRPVFIFDRSSNAPYTDFEVRDIKGSLKSGGWSFNVTVFGDADATEFPDGTLVVLFAEASYGGTAKAFGMNHAGRQNIRCVGWIVDETVRKDPESGDVTFSVQGLAGLMKTRENFSVALDYVSGSPTTWYELKDMDTERAIYHYLLWHSTACFMTDVMVPSVLHSGWGSRPGPYLIKFQDFSRGSLWSSLSRLCEEAFYVCGTDRASCLYVDYNLQCLDSSFRGDVPLVMLLAHRDWAERLEIQRQLERKVSIVDFEGIAFDGTDAEPVISAAPAKVPDYMGSPKPSKRHILDPTGDWQAKANVLAGLKHGEWTNQFPKISFPCMGDYSISDIVPREYFTLTLIAADTKRGIVWTDQRLIVDSMQERYNYAAGACQVTFEFARSALGDAGVTGDYPPADPPSPSPGPPVWPVPPVPSGGEWCEKVYVATVDLGVFYTEDFVTAVTSPAGVPTWAATSTGLNLAHECLGFRGDPFDPAGRQYCLMEDALYRRVPPGDWVSVLAVGDLVGGTLFANNGLETDINTDGHVAVLSHLVNDGAYYNVSYDYGVTWANNLIYTAVGALGPTFSGSLAIGQLKLSGGSYTAGYVMYAVFGHSSMRLWYSVDRGVTWVVCCTLGTSAFLSHLQVDPMNQMVLYVGCTNGAGPWHVARFIDLAHEGGTISPPADNVWYFDRHAENSGAIGYSHVYYQVSVTTGGVVRVGAKTAITHIHGTWDDGETWVETAPEEADANAMLGISLLQSAPDKLYLLRTGAGADGDPHVIWASEDEGATMVAKSGANADVIDTGDGDSIPYNCGGVRGILQIWME